jgi:hypothetical protein
MSDRYVDTVVKSRAVDVLDLDLAENEVYGRIFPFGTVAHVREADGLGGVDEYDEEFLPRCTLSMQQARPVPNWIRFTLDHEQSLDHRIGFCRALTEQADGAYARLKLVPQRDLEKVRALLQESHTGLSVEFIDKRAPRVAGSLRQRVQVHVSAITATPVPLYAEAGILAMRGAEEVTTGTPNLDRVRHMLEALS